MSERMSAVMQRRGELLARIAAQRGQVAQLGSRWEKPLALADQGLAVARYLRDRPVLMAGMVALLVMRRRGIAGLLRGGLRGWQAYRYFTAASAALSSRL
ncbi:MAG: YqjK-like family protein [Nitrosomonadales bacterium]|nr:YqjK-like family protein [Nitrosomonadales bacterium]